MNLKTTALLQQKIFGVAVLILTTLAPGALSLAEEDRGIAPADEETLADSAAFGVSHALIVGIDEYAHWPKLRFAERDATELRDILVSSYGYAPERVTFLKGSQATESEIVRAMNRALGELEADDNLLIFYAGHGQFNALSEHGYWIPHDGTIEDATTWVSFNDVRALVSSPNVKARSVALVTDSCYGGMLAADRAGPSDPLSFPSNAGERVYMERLLESAPKRSRFVLASGGFEKVPDQSLFAKLIKNALRANTMPLLDLELLFYGSVANDLAETGEQSPILMPIAMGADWGGRFVFVRSDAEPGDIPEAPPETTPETTPAIASFSADATTIEAGNSVTLTWESTGASSVELSPLGPVVEAGERVIHPTEATTYTLLARNGAHVTRRELHIDVAAVRALSCKERVQGKIAWDYSGHKKWTPANVTRLCRGAESSPEPARCFQRAMHGGVNWGAGTGWKWQHAVDLCEGSKNADRTLRCFQGQVKSGIPWKKAIGSCDGSPRVVVRCADRVQGKIAWNYQGTKRWGAPNIARLCRGAENSAEPARCFQRVMHGGINWGGGTKWEWKNAVDLCEGTQNAGTTVGCFQSRISAGRNWKQSIASCNRNP